MSPPRPSGFFRSLIVANFGYLTEGLEAIGRISAQRLHILQQRYRRRRDLADYARFPEGYEFEHTLTFREHLVERRAVILLTPPDLVAVQRHDGTWTRRRREVEDGPAPYTSAWYFQYLTTHNLPLWFMRPEHLEIADNDAEAQILGVSNAPRNGSNVPANYLEARYPFPPRNLVPEEQTYGINLNATDLRYLSRRFPATAVNAAHQDYRVFVASSGHVIVRYRDGFDDCEAEERHANTVSWVKKAAQKALASYVGADIVKAEGEDVVPAVAFSRPPRDRSDEIAAAVTAGGFVDIDQIPHGPGRWTWLNPAVDEPLAQALGLAYPVEVTIAVENGRLRAGMPLSARPRVVFTPDRRFFNPTSQPTSNGRWRYFTILGDGSSQALAWLNFGGQGRFVDRPHPTAAQIWRLRQHYQTHIANGADFDDATASIDLVWIPTCAGEESAVEEEVEFLLDPDEINTASANIETETESGSDEEVTDDIDEDSGLIHEPENRGENDQIGTAGARQYQTRMINGKKYTVDRGRANVSVREPHKLWALDKHGAWIRYQPRDTFDWNDKATVEKLNKWRDQVFCRAEWPKKRKHIREVYSLEQRKWVFDLVVEAAGESSDRRMRAIAQEFNALFGTDRPVSGLAALFERSKVMYHRTGGVFRPGQRLRDSMSSAAGPSGGQAGREGEAYEVEDDEVEDDGVEDDEVEDDEVENDEVENDGIPDDETGDDAAKDNEERSRGELD